MPNKDLQHILQIDVVKEEIFKYLDGSALITLSNVNKETRRLVTRSREIKKLVSLRICTKVLDFFSNEKPLLPEWTTQLNKLTLVCNTDPELFFVSQAALDQTLKLQNLSTFEIINESQQGYALNYVNKIMKNVSSKLKSISLPYDILSNIIDIEQVHCQQLEELKFTTCGNKYNVNSTRPSFIQNMDFFATTCLNLKSFSCQEFSKVEGRYVKSSLEAFDQDFGDFLHDDFDGIFKILENNSTSLEKLEFGFSRLLELKGSSSKFDKISFTNLKFFDLRILRLKTSLYLSDQNDEYRSISTVLDILNNLPRPGKLTTLKLTLNSIPLGLFKLIPDKFSRLKCLSLKASTLEYRLHTRPKLSGSHWSFLQLLSELEELEITRFNLSESYDVDFGSEIICGEFLGILPKNNLRKLTLKGINTLHGPTFYNEIVKMYKLRELVVTGCSLDSFRTICSHLKLLEKLDISDLYTPSSSNDATVDNDDYITIKTAFSSLKFLKEVSIDIWNGDISPWLRSMSFPYLRNLAMTNINLGKYDLDNIIDSNPFLKELSIVKIITGNVQDIEIDVDQRTNLKIIKYLNKTKYYPYYPYGELRNDYDPDSNIFTIWPTEHVLENNFDDSN